MELCHLVVDFELVGVSGKVSCQLRKLTDTLVVCLQQRIFSQGRLASLGLCEHKGVSTLCCGSETLVTPATRVPTGIYTPWIVHLVDTRWTQVCKVAIIVMMRRLVTVVYSVNNDKERCKPCKSYPQTFAHSSFWSSSSQVGKSDAPTLSIAMNCVLRCSSHFS